MEKHIGDFMRIVRCTNYFRTQKMADSGITGIQCTYLLCINRTPGISQEQLASQLYKDKSVIARHLASLESNGYIHREPDPKDRRVQKQKQPHPIKRDEAAGKSSSVVPPKLQEI